MKTPREMALELDATCDPDIQSKLDIILAGPDRFPKLEEFYNEIFHPEPSEEIIEAMNASMLARTGGC